jgi:hypothetical protein
MLAAFGLVMVGGAAVNSVQAQAKVWPTNLVNIAAASNGGHVVKSTSMFENDSKWTADNLIDGQVYNDAKGTGSFGWGSSKYDPIRMEAITLGFAGDQSKRIGRIVINPASNTIWQRWAKDISVEASNEGADGPWRSVGELTLSPEPVAQSFTNLPTDARFVRFSFRTNQGSDVNVALGEIEIYEAINTEEPLGNLIGRLEQAVGELKHYRNAQAQLGGIDPKANKRAAAGEAETTPAKMSPETLATLQLVELMTGDDKNVFSSASTNIAASANGGKIVDFSSIFEKNNAYGPNNLIDGQNFNRETNKGSFGWASEGFAPGREFVTIGFKDDRTRVINRIIINPTSNQSSLRWARTINVEVTSDSPKKGPWRTVATINMRFGRGEERNQDFNIRPVEAKYVRFRFMANGPEDIDLPNAIPGVNSDRAVSLGEIEIYEISDSSKVLDALIGRFEGILNDLKRLNDSDAKDAINTQRPKAAIKGAELPDVRQTEQPDVM